MNENGPDKQEPARCTYCNHKRGHAVYCRYASSADVMRDLHLPSHEDAQHAAAYHRAVHGDGDVCGPAAPIFPSREEQLRESAAIFDLPVHTGEDGVVRALEDLGTFGTGAYINHLPTDPQARKDVPLATGCLDYFPDALAAVAATSLAGSRQHHPDKPVHWDRSKSMDESDALLRHFVQRGTLDTDGIRHSAKVAWRALALLQKEIEAECEARADAA